MKKNARDFLRKKKYEKACMAYIRAFEKKHDMYFEWWVADAVGECACFGDYFINFSDVILDIDKKAPKNTFFEWYEGTINEWFKSSSKAINYKSWIMGLRPEHLESFLSINSSI